MTPVFKILAKKQDITNKIASRLQSLRIVDLPGGTSDYIELVLDDPDGKIEKKDLGTEIKAYLGMDSNNLVDMGLYIFDEIEFEGPPMQMRLLASSIDFLSAFKAAVTKTWDSVTLGDIVTTLAKKYGYQPHITPDLKSIAIPHITQATESDLRFLTRLADTYGAVFKAVDKKIIFKPQGDGKSVSGVDLPVTTITPDMVSSWSLDERGRPMYGAVRAGYYDYDLALVKYVTVGTGDVKEELKTIYKSELEATSHAKAQYKKRQMATIAGRITLPATEKVLKTLKSEYVLKLDKFRTGVDGEYNITRVEHDLNKTKGYMLKVEFSKQWKGYK